MKIQMDLSKLEVAILDKISLSKIQDQGFTGRNVLLMVMQ